MNKEYADRDWPLAEGDEVALIPPVSGGGFRLVEGPLDLAAVIAEATDERAGAIATFQGTVRRQSRGREVIALEYEAYSGMAESVMAEIVDEVTGSLRAVRGRGRAPARSGRDRRDERGHRRLGST